MMALENLFQIASEAAIKQSRRTARLGGCDDFGEQATGASGNGGPQHGHGAVFGLRSSSRQIDANPVYGPVTSASPRSSLKVISLPPR